MCTQVLLGAWQTLSQVSVEIIGRDYTENNVNKYNLKN